MANGAPSIPHQDLTYKIIGCAMQVHNQLGPGLKELHYQRGLSAAMHEEGLSFEAEKRVQLACDGKRIGLLSIDHLVEGAVVVEVKALSHLLTSDEISQVVTYLAATNLPVGLLLNFGRTRLEYRRILPPRKLSWPNRIRRYLQPAR